MPENPNQSGSGSSGGSGDSNQQAQGSSGLQTQTTQTTQPQSNVQSTVGNNNTPIGQNLLRDLPNSSVNDGPWNSFSQGRALGVEPTDPAVRLNFSDDEKETAEED